MNEYINLTLENIDEEHICCAIGDKKHQAGVDSKKEWIKSKLKDGHIFRKLNARGKIFIEYEPIETAWIPISGKNYEYIYCLWVAGSFKGKGIGKELIEYAINDSKEKGKSGICTLVSKKKKPFIGEKKFFEHYGFKVVDTIGDYELLALQFDDSETPRFNDNARTMKIDNQDFTIYYSNECPYVEYEVNELTEYAKENNIKINFIKIDSLEKAKKAGIPVIAVDALIYNRSFVDGTVVSNNYQAGEQCAKDLMKRRKKGKILFLVQSENKSAIDRIKGFKETLEKAGWKYENVGELECQGQLELSQPLVEKVLNKTKDIDVVMALNDPSAMGAMAALDAEHMLSDVLVYGADGSPEAKTMIYENKMAATSAQSPRTTGKKTVEMLYKILDGKKTEKQCIVPVSLITKDNINDYSLSGWQ